MNERGRDSGVETIVFCDIRSSLCTERCKLYESQVCLWKSYMGSSADSAYNSEN
ncbi:MAG: hypothetical protein ABIE22_00245 [archaeon]